MLNDVVMQLNMNGMNPGGNAYCVSPQGNQGNSSPNSFTDILQAIFSGLDKGIVNLKNGLAVNADGKAITIDELMQKLFVEGDSKPGSGDAVIDALQQMIAQIQMTGVQPVMIVNQRQDKQNNADGRGNKNLIPLFPPLLKGGRGGLSGSEAQKGNPFVDGSFFMQAKSEIKADSLQEGKTPAVSEFMTRNDQPVIPVIKEVTASGNEKPGFVRGGSTSNNDNGVQVFVKALGMRDKDVLSSGKNIATANAISNDGAAPAKNGFKISDDLVESRVITQNSEKASVSTIKAAVNTETLEVSPSIKGAQADKGAVEKASSKEADNVFASAIQVHQTPYDKNGPAPKETIHVSRLNELGEPIMKTLGAGDKQLVIKLAPPDLGNIQIRLTMDHGVLRADFRVDSQAVKELFSIAMPQIKNSIEDSGIKAGDFFVDLREDHYSDGGRQQDNNNQQHKQQKESKSQFFDFFA